MSQYRLTPEVDVFGLWWVVERKGWFFWTPLVSLKDKEAALNILETLEEVDG